MATTKKIPTARQVGDEEMVKIRIPRTRGDNEPIYVSVNERDWLIKPGVDVIVPVCVKEVLDHSDEAYIINESFEDSYSN